MKRLLIFFFSLFMALNYAFAGGLVTNTNQSAAWARMLVRDASTSVDAVYYNPAGLTKLADGLHISVSNQSIFQDRTITSTFPPLHNPEFEGSVSAPLFPDLYAAYKKGKFAFSLGFMPIGGGGSAVFDNGIPMIEIPVSSLTYNFAEQGVTDYGVISNFEGSSVYFGIQGGISYAINDMISVYAGARYVWAKNTYTGEVKDITVTTAGGTLPASTFMTNLAALASGGATQNYNAATGMNGLVTAYPANTFDQVIAATAGDPATQAQVTALRDGLTNQGVQNAGSLTMTQGQATYNTLGDTYTAQATQLTAGSALMVDQEADVTQTGNGWTPILGLNLSLMDGKLNIGAKYEFKTNMTLVNETAPGKGFVIGIDPGTGAPVEMFPDGEETNADIPAMLSLGVNYKFSDKFSAMVGYHTYWDKKTGWENVEDEIDKNYWELAGGLEYNLNDRLLLSAGYLRAQPGVNENYQSNLSYSLPSNTFGLGGAFKINDMLTLQLGGYYTMYESATYDESYTLGDNVTQVPFKTTYEKSNWAIAVGLDFTFGGK
ncbi:MAG: outer membrane protein transport protein [Bacteroidales bacterium]